MKYPYFGTLIRVNPCILILVENTTPTEGIDMDATGEMLQKRIAESHRIMNDLYVREASREAATLDRMAAKADVLMRLVANCRQDAV